MRNPMESAWGTALLCPANWNLFPFKAYIIAVPLAVLLCQLIAHMLHQNKPAPHDMSYENRRLEARILQEDIVDTFKSIEIGYCLCIAVMLLDATIAALKRNKIEFRSAIIFVVLAAISLVALYSIIDFPFILNPQ